MKLCSRKIIHRRKRLGKGLINSLIDKLPFELHLPGGYQYCGPGTKLEKRLARGDVGINPLDSACKDHDIAYSTHQDLENRHAADLVLLQRARERIADPTTPFGEKTAARFVKTIMKTKRRLGAGVKKCKKRGGSLKKKKHGGFLLPILTSALSAFRTYREFKNAKKMLADQQAHNKRMEELTKSGKGFYLRPYGGKGLKKKKRKKKRSFL